MVSFGSRYRFYWADTFFFSNECPKNSSLIRQVNYRQSGQEAVGHNELQPWHCHNSSVCYSCLRCFHRSVEGRVHRPHNDAPRNDFLFCFNGSHGMLQMLFSYRKCLHASRPRRIWYGAQSWWRFRCRFWGFYRSVCNCLQDCLGLKR